MNLKICHYDDGKGKNMSHECSLHDFVDAFEKYNLDYFNLTDIVGYGETLEEAIKDLKNQLDFFFKEIRAVEKLVMETDVLENDIVEIDCVGKVIE